MKVESRKIRYRYPVRIIDCSDNLSNVGTLLKEKDDQIFLDDGDLLTIHGPGYIVLDYGEEICGGIRILSHIKDGQDKLTKIRIRFGESVSETYSSIGEKGATNNHALRDFTTDLPAFSDESRGETGFRFVRIDFLSESETYHPIKMILAKEVYHDLAPIHTFRCEDELLNKIYATAAHTVTLCVQNRIWDGIKRDRLVWIGDMEPEIHSLLHLYGHIEQIDQTIETAKISNPMPCWINNIPSYSAWFLLIIYDIYRFDQKPDIVYRHFDYLNEIIKLFDRSIEDNGNVDFLKVNLPNAMPYFIDWPTYREGNENERREACIMLLQYIFPKILEMYQDAKEDTKILEGIIHKLDKAKVNVPQTKVFASFYQLLHRDEESYKILIKDGARGMSTFMSYYLLKAVAQQNLNEAIALLKEYYGGMLSRGATSFWEDFNVDWLEGSSRIDELPKKGEKDLHGDFGGYCYVGFRHSLCHGWSSGPVSFLLEEYKKK